jgi:hypothetical protein
VQGSVLNLGIGPLMRLDPRWASQVGEAALDKYLPLLLLLLLPSSLPNPSGAPRSFPKPPFFLRAHVLFVHAHSFPEKLSFYVPFYAYVLFPCVRRQGKNGSV